MKEYSCKIIIEDTLEAESKEDAQSKFLTRVANFGVKYYCLATDVEVEEAI